MKRVLAAACITAAGFAGLGGIGYGSAHAAGTGNSGAAMACQQLGYLTVVGLDSSNQPVTFTNTGQCVSYAAHGGTLYQESTTTVTVDTLNPSWQPSGVNLAAGQVATITAVDNNATCDAVNDPTGCPSAIAAWDYLAPGLPSYTLVGQVDSQAPFEVGSGTTATGPGELYFGFNDNVFYDNGGSYTVTITTYTPIA